jgi:hypothetical protein
MFLIGVLLFVLASGDASLSTRDPIPLPEEDVGLPLQDAQLPAHLSRSSGGSQVSVSSHMTNECVKDQVVSIIKSGSNAIGQAVRVLDGLSKDDFDIYQKPFFEQADKFLITWLVKPVLDILEDLAAKGAFVMSVRQNLKTDKRFTTLSRLIQKITENSDDKDATMFAASVTALALFVAFDAAEKAVSASLNVQYAAPTPALVSAVVFRKRPVEAGMCCYKYCALHKTRINFQTNK